MYPPNSWEEFCYDQERTHEPSDADFLANAPLDAYGHLNWTVGNEDWLACFDACLSPDGTRIAYHVVVDCESGGFIDTVESGVIPVENISSLKSLPQDYLDRCIEQYAGEESENGMDYRININAASLTYDGWCAHLSYLANAAINKAEGKN